MQRPDRHLRRISLALLCTIGIIAWDQQQGISFSQSQPSLLSIARAVAQHDHLLKVVTDQAEQDPVTSITQVAELDQQTQRHPLQESQTAFLELMARSARSRHLVR